jgi:integrase
MFVISSDSGIELNASRSRPRSGISKGATINERHYSPEPVNHFAISARFLYNVTLETPWPENALPRCRVLHKLPVVLSAPAVHEFFQHVCNVRNRAALMTAYGAGSRVSEAVSLQVGAGTKSIHTSGDGMVRAGGKRVHTSVIAACTKQADSQSAAGWQPAPQSTSACATRGGL